RDAIFQSHHQSSLEASRAPSTSEPSLRQTMLVSTCTRPAKVTVTRAYPSAGGLQPHLAQALDDEAHAVAGRRKSGSDSASRHHDHAALEPSAAAVEEVRQTCHRLEGMPHRVAG